MPLCQPHQHVVWPSPHHMVVIPRLLSSICWAKGTAAAAARFAQWRTPAWQIALIGATVLAGKNIYAIHLGRCKLFDNNLVECCTSRIKIDCASVWWRLCNDPFSVLWKDWVHTSTSLARLAKLEEVIPNACVSRLPKTLPSMKLAMWRLISMPNTVASTPYMAGNSAMMNNADLHNLLNNYWTLECLSSQVMRLHKVGSHNEMHMRVWYDGTCNSRFWVWRCKSKRFLGFMSCGKLWPTFDNFADSSEVLTRNTLPWGIIVLPRWRGASLQDGQLLHAESRQRLHRQRSRSPECGCSLIWHHNSACIAAQHIMRVVVPIAFE